MKNTPFFFFKRQWSHWRYWYIFDIDLMSAERETWSTISTIKHQLYFSSLLQMGWSKYSRTNRMVCFCISEGRAFSAFFLPLHLHLPVFPVCLCLCFFSVLSCQCWVCHLTLCLSVCLFDMLCNLLAAACRALIWINWYGLTSFNPTGWHYRLPHTYGTTPTTHKQTKTQDAFRCHVAFIGRKFEVLNQNERHCVEPEFVCTWSMRVKEMIGTKSDLIQTRYNK